MSHDKCWSIFELLDRNLRVPSLRQRYAGVIRQLANRSQALLDVLLISCYVHSCRTPVSFDMLLAYFRDTVSDYRAVYKMRDKLAALLSDATGSLVDDVQDYYVPRSVALSESVIQETPSTMLGPFIKTFHERISPGRIHRYDIFKRRAYDHTVLSRLFRTLTKVCNSIRGFTIEIKTPMYFNIEYYLSCKEGSISRGVSLDRRCVTSNEWEEFYYP